MTARQGLFSNSLISSEVVTSLPERYIIRSLEKSDYSKGYLDCLRVLTWVGDLTEEQFEERYDEMNSQGRGTYYLLVVEYGNRIIATGSLIVEKKFIHNRGLVGHIEEISVAKEHQGKKLGLKMIQAIDSIAKNLGCYKTILDCGPKNEPFYIKCGFKNSGIEMSHYFEQEEKEGYYRG